jgi:Phage integrase, N-terminal SAM-like domain
MNTEEAVRRLKEVVRRKHLALATEQAYCAWLRRYCDFLNGLPLHLPSQHKLERFLTVLAQNHVAASTQNQAFNAILFFYKEALGIELENIQALRARRPARIRHAPTPQEIWQLQPGQLPAAGGAAPVGAALDADDLAGEADQNWGEGRAPFPSGGLSDGGSGGAERVVPGHSGGD